MGTLTGNAIGIPYGTAGGGAARMVGGWLNDTCSPAPTTVNLPQLAVFLRLEGWNPVVGPNTISVDGETETREFLMACDFSTVAPSGLAHDLCEGMQLQGLCAGGCNSG